MTIPTQIVAATETLTAEEIKARAESIIEDLKQYADQAEADRRLRKESVELIKNNGLLRTVQPKSCGGHELPFRSYIDVLAAVGEGCGATAWVLGVWHAHSWLMGHFPRQAQQDVYGDNPDTFVSAVIAPRGKAVRQGDGSYVLNGFWPFGSGCEHSQWLILGAEVFDESGEMIDEADLLMPTGDVEIRDDWYVAGLQGTGSNSLVARDVRIPPHRYLSIPQYTEREAPAYKAEDTGWLTRSQAVPVLAICLVGGALGVARAALKEFKKIVPGKKVPYTSHIADAWIPVQVALGSAAAEIHAAELVMYKMADDIDHYAGLNEAMPMEMRGRIRMDCCLSVKMLLDAVDRLFHYAGASALSLRNMLQRASRDLHATNMHALLMYDASAEIYGRILLGKGSNSPVI
ncbi:MAG: hypothetical protein OXS28_12210 [Gammaproteobacteria bacterium]|nr:hypothetical protein [Gammaproteobacteria bacterium]